jgi:hypothetical protein
LKLTLFNVSTSVGSVGALGDGSAARYATRSEQVASGVRRGAGPAVIGILGVTVLDIARESLVS